MIVPDAMKALAASTGKSGVPERTLELVNLRTSKITGCSACVDMHPRVAKKAGETDERLFDRGSLGGGRHPTSPTPNAPPWPSRRPSRG